MPIAPSGDGLLLLGIGMVGVIARGDGDVVVDVIVDAEVISLPMAKFVNIELDLDILSNGEGGGGSSKRRAGDCWREGGFTKGDSLSELYSIKEKFDYYLIILF